MTWDEQWSDPATVRKWLNPDATLVALARELPRSGATRALDVGCGAGRHVVFLAREGYETFGCDFSRPAVDHCRAWLAREGLDATVVQADMRAVPFPDGQFDLVVAYNVIYHTTFAGMQGVVEHLARKLRPGGSLYATLKGPNEWVYGRGHEIEPNTFLREGKAVPVHFSTEDEIPLLFGSFDAVSHSVRDYVKESTQRRHHIIKVIARKPALEDAGRRSAA